MIGNALFIVFGLVNENLRSDADNQVVVSAGRIEQLDNIFAKTWRAPTYAIGGLAAYWLIERLVGLST